MAVSYEIIIHSIYLYLILYKNYTILYINSCVYGYIFFSYHAIVSINAQQYGNSVKEISIAWMIVQLYVVLK